VIATPSCADIWAEPGFDRELMANLTLVVTGGAGYIGSHVARQLRDLGHRLIVIDDLRAGVREAVKKDELVVGDFADQAIWKDLAKRYRIDGVLHFAASVSVPESVAKPWLYHDNNTARTARLIALCVELGIGKLLFSSTAAVYGAPQDHPITEATPCRPINPYGWSKLMGEQIIADTCASGKLDAVCLRYFNVAGADWRANLGPWNRQAAHLISVACRVAAGRQPAIEVFGTDYATADGSCVRDFIHVDDLARAHVDCLAYLFARQGLHVFNCGYGHGYSVFDVINVLKAVSGRALAVRHGPRRAGDPPSIVADAGKIREQVGWRPRHERLEDIIDSAWRWELRYGCRQASQSC